jgi:hypothetical protein
MTVSPVSLYLWIINLKLMNGRWSRFRPIQTMIHFKKTLTDVSDEIIEPTDETDIVKENKITSN